MEKNKLIDKNILKKLIEESDNIVFFGGAGVSTASNIPDFRSPTGLYNEKVNLIIHQNIFYPIAFL